MKISEFKIGSILTRVEPAKPYSNGGVRDRSYIGDKLKLVDICNGSAYFRLYGHNLLMNHEIKLSLDLWSEGWKFYYNYDDYSNLKKQIKSDLLSEIRIAVETNDTEFLEELKEIFDNNYEKVKD